MTAVKAIKITANNLLVNSGAGTFDYTVPAKSYIELQAYVYRDAGGTGQIQVYLPMPNDTFNVTSVLAVDTAVVFNQATDLYKLPQGTKLRVITTGAASLQVAFTEFTSA